MSSTANENFNKELDEEIRSDEERIQVRDDLLRLEPSLLNRATELRW